MTQCFGCVIFKHVKDCHYKIDGRDCKAIRKEFEEAQKQSTIVNQQIKDAILLLGECLKKVPACKSKPQEWPSCDCLHCRIEYFILQNGNR